MLGASPHREQCSRRPTGRLLSALYRRMTVGVTGLTPRGSWPVRDRSYYGSVRLPAVVLHRRTSLDFTMRPRRAPLGGRRLSRFSRRLFPYMLGVSDLARYLHASPKRHVDSRLPLLLTGSASRTKFFSRLNTQPARSPVNASVVPLRAPPLGRHGAIDSFIHYNLPVYPGAQGEAT